MDPLLAMVLVLAIIYAAIQFGWVLCIFFLMGVMYITSLIRNIALTLLLMVQRQRIIKIIKLKAKQARRST